MVPSQRYHGIERAQVWYQSIGNFKKNNFVRTYFIFISHTLETNFRVLNDPRGAISHRFRKWGGTSFVQDNDTIQQEVVLP